MIKSRVIGVIMLEHDRGKGRPREHCAVQGCWRREQGNERQIKRVPCEVQLALKLKRVTGGRRKVWGCGGGRRRGQREKRSFLLGIFSACLRGIFAPRSQSKRKGEKVGWEGEGLCKKVVIANRFLDGSVLEFSTSLFTCKAPLRHFCCEPCFGIDDLRGLGALGRPLEMLLGCLRAAAAGLVNGGTGTG